MSSQSVSLTQRHKTRTPGIFYRLKADGSKSFQVSAGSGKYVTVKTEKEALALQAELRTRKTRGERIVVNDKTRFSDLAEEWFATKSLRLRPRTKSYYRDALDLVLLPRFGSSRVSAIDVDAVAELIRDLELRGLNAVDRKRPVRPLGRSSIDNYLKPLQGILKLARRKGIVRDNPFNLLTQDDRPAATETAEPHEWTDDELSRLFDAAAQLSRKSASRYDYTPLLRVVSRLGLRVGEALGLQWQDFDKDAGVLRVRRQWLRTGLYGPTKTKAGVRDIALPDDVVDYLSLLHQASPFKDEEHPVFSSLTGTPLGHRNVSRRGAEPAFKLAGLEGVSIHDLRHAAASRLIDAGLDAVEVAAILGHENANITLSVYSHRFNAVAKADRVRAAL